MTRTIQAVDLFCGAGGTSTGLVEAVEEMERRSQTKLRLNLVAVNHWPVAIATHSRNHSFAQHYCNSLKGVNPRAVITGPVDLLVASPECTHHSNARGGRPMEDQSRSSGADVVRWIGELMPRTVIIENVREYRSWGPLGKTGRPIKSRKGEYFQKFLDDIRALGYSVDHRLINCADYGDPTTRTRLFISCRRGGRPIAWPSPTNAKYPGLLGLQKWRTARESVIDWSDIGTSIFNRKRPLSHNTMRRIEAGLYKFSNIDLRGWLVKLYGTSDGATADRPCPTVTGGGQHIGLAVPFQIRTDCAGGKTAGFRRIDDPAATVVGSGGLGLVDPQAFLLGQQTPAAPRSTNEPVPTVAGKGAIAKIEPFMIAHFGEREGQKPRTHSVDEPTPAVTSRGAAELAQSFIAEFHGGPDAAERVKSVDEPLPTQTTEPRFGLAQPYIVNMKGKSDACDIDKPTPAQTTKRHQYIAQPFMLSAGGPEVGPRSTEDPAHTVLTRDHIGLATPFVAGAGGPSGSGKPQSVEEPLGTVLGENHRAVIVPVTHPDQPGDDPAARTKSVDAPLPTVMAAHRGELGVATAFLVQYNGTAETQSVDKPIGALTGKPRYALLVTFVNGSRVLMDILFRMLRPRELARAQGFPDSYQFQGTTKDVVKQIGNAVPVQTAKALCLAALA